MNLAKIRHRGSQVIFWDLGGQARMRSMWEKYYTEANAVVFVVDSADVSRLEEAKVAFDGVLDDEPLTSSNTPVITFANKQDLEDALSAGDLVLNFYADRHRSSGRIMEGGSDRPCVFAVSAITCEGIDNALSAVIDAARW
eukprot:CAMPEP_0185019462 /NCGR_PEP_ID=MMETSP1103-20130426/2074_1 /TAXON_ID=36769 /ORGANISM="Paraphysomonas bandaiensis, Strain Caron Lab Isolate" /LENGTH=140 /DNA_ID=CAMNT_0027549789 /DNA_START=240 /DNA_END=659 /DNA_ORIENTATION=+